MDESRSDKSHEPPPQLSRPSRWLVGAVALLGGLGMLYLASGEFGENQFYWVSMPFLLIAGACLLSERARWWFRNGVAISFIVGSIWLALSSRGDSEGSRGVLVLFLLSLLYLCESFREWKQRTNLCTDQSGAQSRHSDR
jgi:hypothetical protein